LSFAKGPGIATKGTTLGRGRDNTVQRLLEDPAFAAKVEAQVREKLSVGEGFGAEGNTSDSVSDLSEPEDDLEESYGEEE
jgi:hypothetical protein